MSNGKKNRLAKQFASSSLPLLAFHSSTSDPVDIHVRRLTCADTGVSVLANATLSPFSPFTGGDMNNEGTDTEIITAEELKTFPVVASCNDCKTIYHSTEELSSTINGETFNCLVCGEQINSNVEKVEAEDEDEDEEHSEEEIGNPEDCSEEDVVCAGEETFTEEKEVTVTSSENNLYGFNLMEIVTASQINDQNVDLVLSSGKTPTWYLIVDSKPIATLSSEDSSNSIKKIFNNKDALPQAFFSSIGDGLTQEVIANFGIKQIDVQVNVDNVVDQQIRDARNEVIANFETRVQELEDDFMQCLGIASVGINKGLFSTTPNILRKEFNTELSRLNINKPERVVDRVLARIGDQYIASIIEKAQELREKSLEARNDLAEMVETATYQPTEPEDLVSEQLTEKLSQNNISLSSVRTTVDEESNLNNIHQQSDGVSRMRSIFNFTPRFN